MMDCSTCTERLQAFLDGELNPPETEHIQAHLDSCSDCFGRSEVEEAFRRTIRELAIAPPAPPALEFRIRQALREEYAREDGLANAETDEQHDDGALATPQPRSARAPRVRRWLSRSLAAAAILLAAVMAHDVFLGSHGLGLAPVEHRVSLTGELVCLDCLIASRALPLSGLDIHLDEGVQTERGTESHHDLHLRLADGTVWQLFARGAPELELGGHVNAGRTATLLGTSYPDLRVIQVARAVLN